MESALTVVEMRKLFVHALWYCPAAQDVWGDGSSIFLEMIFCRDNIYADF